MCPRSVRLAHKGRITGACRKDSEKENQTMLHVMKRKCHCRRLPKLSAFQILPLASSLLLQPVHLLWPSCPPPAPAWTSAQGPTVLPRPPQRRLVRALRCPRQPRPRHRAPHASMSWPFLFVPFPPHRPRHTGPADLVTDGARPATVPHPLSPSPNPGTESRPSGPADVPALRNAFCISSVPRRHCESASGAIRPPSQARC